MPSKFIPSVRTTRTPLRQFRRKWALKTDSPASFAARPGLEIFARSIDVRLEKPFVMPDPPKISATASHIAIIWNQRGMRVERPTNATNLPANAKTGQMHSSWQVVAPEKSLHRLKKRSRKTRAVIVQQNRLNDNSCRPSPRIDCSTLLDISHRQTALPCLSALRPSDGSGLICPP